MRIKLTNSIFFYLVGVRKYKQKFNSLQLRSTISPRSPTQSNHHGTECSDLLVYSSTANARLAASPCSQTSFPVMRKLSNLTLSARGHKLSLLL